MTSDLALDRVPDLLVVGAGPAGMAAAVTALAGGLTVDLLDAGSEVGGQYWRHPPRGGDVAPDPGQYHGLQTYRRLRTHLDHYAASGALRWRPSHHVWTVERHGTTSNDEPRFTLHAVDRSGCADHDRAVRVHGRRLLVATGAFDRPLPFDGWDLPGVTTVGALQALLKGNGVVAGRRVLVAGTGPFLLPVATGLARAGARVVGVCEAASLTGWASHVGVAVPLPGKVLEGASYAARLARHRIPLWQRTVVVRASGTPSVSSAVLASVDASGRVRPGTERVVEVDAVGVGWGFVPQLDLLRTLGCELIDGHDCNQVVRMDDDGRTNVPGVYAAGEVGGVGGAELALRQGQLAAEGILHDAGVPGLASTRRRRALRRLTARHRAFAAAMHAAHPLLRQWTAWADDDVTVCRCEEIDVGSVRAAVACGAGDVRQVKQLTRAGMGWCQGRMCAAAVDGLVHEQSAGLSEAPVPVAAERLVAAPVSLGALAAEADA